MERTLRQRSPGLMSYSRERLDEVGADDRAFFGGVSAALVGLGVVTLVLALVGIYAMLALIVTRRTREIGIRVALGATSGMVVRTILARAGAQVFVGGGAGVALAWFTLQGRSMLVTRIGDGGPWTLPLVLVLLIGAGLVAVWAPIRRALAIRPQEAMRQD
jgi:putative ABC transport system permease protein